jgi:hypothetical protein
MLVNRIANPQAVVAATASDPEDAVAECALAALGAELREGILVFGSAASAAPPAPESLESQLATFIQQQKTGPCGPCVTTGRCGACELDPR